MFENLKITAHLMTPVVSDVFLPIDAVLYYQVHREALGAQDIAVPGHMAISDGSHRVLPLKKVNTFKRHDSRLWFYAASFAVWPAHTREGTDHWNKRVDVSLIDLVDWQGRTPRIDVASGRYKSYHMPIFYRTALSIDWYVVGDQAEIERLLSTATSLGKKGAQGWGCVRAWDVQPWHSDWSLYNDAGRLMRAIPDQQSSTVYGIRPSYWNPKNQTLCKLPTPETS